MTQLRGHNRQRKVRVMASRPFGETDADDAHVVPEHAMRWAESPYRYYYNDAMVEAAEAGTSMDFDVLMARAKELGDEAIAAGDPRRIGGDFFARERGHPPVVYYMRMSTLVKIGTTVNIKSRTESVGPQGVMAVERGGYDVEKSRHNQFAHLHSHLEWFHLAEDLWAHISSLRDGFAQREGMSVDEWLRRWGVSRPDTPNRPAA